MKITHVICQVLRPGSMRTDVVTNAREMVLVRLRTDTGVEGVGEAGAAPEIVKTIFDLPLSPNVSGGLREVLVGENPLEHERLWRKMAQATAGLGRSSVATAAMAAVDMALWDLKGKHWGEPIHCLLGGRRHEQLPVCAVVSFGRDRSETQAIARRWVKSGFQAVKFIRSAGEDARDSDIEHIRAARAGLGDQPALLVDAVQGWDVRTALARAQAFGEFQVSCIEDPLRSADMEGWAWLRNHSRVPIAAGKQLNGRECFQPFLDRRALDVYQVDPSRCGLTDAAFIRARAEEIGGGVSNHCPASAITVAASLHWLSTCEQPALFQDYVDDSRIRHDLILEKIEADSGVITVPDLPGLGITLNEEFIKEFVVAESGR